VKTISSLINTTLTRWKCTFYLCFPTLAALDSKRILSESASLHIVHKCTKMYLLAVPSFNHLHFHRPRNYRHVLVRNNTVWAQPSYRDTNKHLGDDKLGGMTDWTSWNHREQVWNIWKSFLKWRFPWRCRRGCLSSLFSSQRHREKEIRAAEKLCTWNWPAVFELRANFNLDQDPILTSRIRGQAPKRYPKCRARWQIFCFFGEEFHWDRMHYESSSNGQQLNSVWSVHWWVQKIYGFWSDLLL